jgi:hypothetical protein
MGKKTLADTMDASLRNKEEKLMLFSPEEMNFLSTRLEEEAVRLRQGQSDELAATPEERQRELRLISELQRKLRDLKSEMTQEEKALVARLARDEIHHIHGHGTGVYQSILQKVEQ